MPAFPAVLLKIAGIGLITGVRSMAGPALLFSSASRRRPFFPNFLARACLRKLRARVARSLFVCWRSILSIRWLERW